MSTQKLSEARAKDEYAHIKPLPDPPRKPDGMQESRFIFNARFIISRYFRHRTDVLVNGYGYLCYDTRDRTDWTYPDCIVALGVDPRAIEARNGYVISEVGKPPDFVLEVASESTRRNDNIEKRRIYATLGVSEYWRFDNIGSQHHNRPIAGDLLVGGAYRPVEIRTNVEGVTWGHSPLLGLDLCWDTGRLRLYDPLRQEYLLDENETADLAEDEATARMEAEARADTADARATTAEARANTAEAQVERLKEELRRRTVE